MAKGNTLLTPKHAVNTFPEARRIRALEQVETQVYSAFANSCPARALANQNATFQLRQSGRVSCRHAQPAKGEVLDFSARHAKTRTPHATPR